jgi:hypothetical protein
MQLQAHTTPTNVLWPAVRHPHDRRQLLQTARIQEAQQPLSAARGQLHAQRVQRFSAHGAVASRSQAPHRAHAVNVLLRRALLLPCRLRFLQVEAGWCER